jgi:hypothetical protein
LGVVARAERGSVHGRGKGRIGGGDESGESDQASGEGRRPAGLVLSVEEWAIVLRKGTRSDEC